MSYRPVIGLEIHAELKTASKMFCSCKNDPFNSEPNTNVCPICLGFPGTLPVPNKQAVEWTVMAGVALHCVPQASKFDRKNYFYPDLPKGYQISQYDLPFTSGGWLEILRRKVRIRRIHLEEDTGKLIHPMVKSHSLVDFNRAGVPLIELVTEPDIESAAQAKTFAEELQRILRYLGVSRADMEKGELRVEANVSVQRAGSKVQGTKVEVKNLNSFRSVERAIAYEVARQTEELEHGGKIIHETRGWDEKKERTVLQRSKELAEDYRYFPEPDVPPIAFAKSEIESLKSKVPELPEQRRKRYVEMGLTDYDANVLVSDKELADFFEKVVGSSKISAKIAANWIVNEGIEPKWGEEKVGMLLTRVIKGTAAAAVAKEAIKAAKLTGNLSVPGETAVVDVAQLQAHIEDVIKTHAKAVSDFKQGKAEAFGFLIGQVIAATRGSADPGTVNDLLRKALEK
jgi:aspartyl-tRNA(Asn)/glutamyl-tRNA(Gln) amidotransferase subunit B